MNCYRTACREECDSLKVQYCLWKVSREQFNLKQKISDSRVCDCGAITTRCKQKGEAKRICFLCKRGLSQ